VETLENLQLDENRLLQMEYLLEQSRLGHHLLFDKESITRVFTESEIKENSLFKVDNLARIQNLLAEFMDKESIRKKRDFISELNREDHDLLVRTYFNIIENSITSNSNMRH
jgi:DNA primase catalytic subunit